MRWERWKEFTIEWRGRETIERIDRIESENR